ncbi:hypothetical protein FGO68_gene2711 [Halteria grandinella]|uniref:Uncharacterized protein n=1 Tax=Halteria grandinella TaxID=5974 RepID=A0A8J8NZE1_HALGN|nr:hypothetical protein FGO68_gene2711 [Halteria grandinella]
MQLYSKFEFKMEEFKSVKWDLLKEELEAIGEDTHTLRQCIINKQIEIDTLKEQISILQGNQLRFRMYNQNPDQSTYINEPFEKKYKEQLIEGLETRYQLAVTQTQLKESDLKAISGYQQWYECLLEISAMLDKYKDASDLKNFTPCFSSVRQTNPSTTPLEKRNLEERFVDQNEEDLNETVLIDENKCDGAGSQTSSQSDQDELDPYNQKSSFANQRKCNMTTLNLQAKRPIVSQLSNLVGASASKNITNVLIENLQEQKNKLKSIDLYLLSTPMRPSCERKTLQQVRQPPQSTKSQMQKNETLLFQNSNTRRSSKHKEQQERLKKLVGRSSSPGEKIEKSNRSSQRDLLCPDLGASIPAGLTYISGRCTSGQLLRKQQKVSPQTSALRKASPFSLYKNTIAPTTENRYTHIKSNEKVILEQLRTYVDSKIPTIFTQLNELQQQYEEYISNPTFEIKDRQILQNLLMDSSTLNITDKELLVDYLIHHQDPDTIKQRRDARIYDLLQISFKQQANCNDQQTPSIIRGVPQASYLMNCDYQEDDAPQTPGEESHQDEIYGVEKKCSRRQYLDNVFQSEENNQSYGFPQSTLGIVQVTEGESMIDNSQEMIRVRARNQGEEGSSIEKYQPKFASDRSTLTKEEQICLDRAIIGKRDIVGGPNNIFNTLLDKANGDRSSLETPLFFPPGFVDSSAQPIRQQYKLHGVQGPIYCQKQSQLDSLLLDSSPSSHKCSPFQRCSLTGPNPTNESSYKLQTQPHALEQISPIDSCQHPSNFNQESKWQQEHQLVSPLQTKFGWSSSEHILDQQQQQQALVLKTFGMSKNHAQHNSVGSLSSLRSKNTRYEKTDSIDEEDSQLELHEPVQVEQQNNHSVKVSEQQSLFLQQKVLQSHSSQRDIKTSQRSLLAQGVQRTAPQESKQQLYLQGNYSQRQHPFGLIRSKVSKTIIENSDPNHQHPSSQVNVGLKGNNKQTNNSKIGKPPSTVQQKSRVVIQDRSASINKFRQ